MSESKLILCVVGARPNFMKIAPIMRAIDEAGPALKAKLLHTGQHYDADMKQSFFEQLSIPEPDIDLGVGGGSHAVQTAEVMKRFEPYVDDLQPAAILVVGDVNSTISCALVAAKKRIPVVHVEAGLRSYDRDMPEEINRVLTDQISDLLFTTEADALGNLTKEGIDADRVCFVGNVMIDTLRYNLDSAVSAADTLKAGGNDPRFIDDGYGLVTMHRPSNVDNPSVFKTILSTLKDISLELPLVFPVHPRTANRLEEFGLHSLVESGRIVLLPPLGYLEMLGMMQGAKIVLTDSGGIQEETTALGVPCVTLRENTERPITVTEGTNTIAGSSPGKIQECYRAVMDGNGKTGRIPHYWDGAAAKRIVERLISWLQDS